MRTAHEIVDICYSSFNDADGGFLLNYYDSEGNPVTDTFHLELEDAVHQAEFEYVGTRNTWIKI